MIKHTSRPDPRPYCGDYEIHADGRVFSYKGWRGQTYKEITQSPDKYGYPCVRLVIRGKRKRLRVHYLVAIAFHGPKPSPLHQVCHIDGNKENNHYDNLKWGSALENAADRERHGRTSRGLKHASKVIAGQNARLIAAAPTMYEAIKAMQELFNYPGAITDTVIPKDLACGLFVLITETLAKVEK